MKKRIVDSELETAKKSTKVMALIILICILLLVGLSVHIIYLYKTGNLFKTDDGKYIIKDKLKDPTVKKEDVLQIDVNDTDIVNLWNIVKVSNNECLDGSYKDKKQVKVKDLTPKCKLIIAKKIFKDDITYNQETNITSVPVDKVLSSYKTIFGEELERPTTIPYKNNVELMYNIENDYYFINGKLEDNDSTYRSYEKIITVNKTDKDLYITSTPVYYEEVSNVICKDSTCEEVLEKLSNKVEYNDEYFELYLESKKDKLSKYTYHFKQNDAGFYKYIGYEKTN